MSGHIEYTEDTGHSEHMGHAEHAVSAGHIKNAESMGHTGHSEQAEYTLAQVWERLKTGNERYIAAMKNDGDISPERRRDTAVHGQHPYAVVIACADSRVIPEDIFLCGIGDLFTIRVAGNIISDFQLGSVEYALRHLGCPLTLVLGHTHCGAVGAAISGHGDGYIQSITDEIHAAIGDETDDVEASRKNAEYSAEKIRQALALDPALKDFTVASAVYDVETGKVLW